MTTISDLIRIGNRLKREGNLDEAIALYRRIIEVNPNFTWAYYNLGDIFVQQEKLNESITEYRQALEVNPNSALFLYCLGKTLAYKGDLEAAIEYLQKAVKVNSDHNNCYHLKTQHHDNLIKTCLNKVIDQKNFKSKTLKELYLEHKGKVSDKWSSYLLAYDQILKDYRNLDVSLLEIGVQNGGSLELWSKYFHNAKLIVGCDINPKCADLAYNDSKIHVIIGDVNTDEVESNITKLSKSFDIVIDDGSHTSSDIIKSFIRFFPLLRNGGVYIAEDLHTSYWKKYQGGLFYPFSSINFFKNIVDIINYEHWGLEKKRAELLYEFLNKYDIKIDPSELQSIYSIEFFNSLCVIKKCNPEHNTLGERCVTGLISQVTKNPQRLNKTVRVAPDQANNEWSVFDLLHYSQRLNDEC